MVLLLSGFDIEYDLTAPPLKFGETRLSWHMDQAYYALTKKLVNRFNEPLSKSSYGIDLPNTPIKKKKKPRHPLHWERVEAILPL